MIWKTWKTWSIKVEMKRSCVDKHKKKNHNKKEKEKEIKSMLIEVMATHEVLVKNFPNTFNNGSKRDE